MANDVMALEERIGRLEETVANGFANANREMDGVKGRIGRLEETVAWEFFEVNRHVRTLNGRVGRLEDRVDALNGKFDVVSERLEGKIQTVLEGLDAFKGEMRRTTDAIVKEHRADRHLIFEILKDHTVRLRDVEWDGRGRPVPPAGGQDS